MKQTLFEARYGTRWVEFERWIEVRERTGRVSDVLREVRPFPDLEFPHRYREICQLLALARDRQYSPELVERLNRLALRGHHLLYRARARNLAAFARFITTEYPRLVREEWRFVLAAVALLFVPLAVISFVVATAGDAAYYFLSPEQATELREMYADQQHIAHRQAATDVAAFGFYVWNNISIDFKTFAGGIVFGLGSVFFLVYNGLFIGAVKGYLWSVGLGENLLQFVAGHSGPELIGAALSGAAGLKLGAALVAPGGRSRKQALVDAARVAIRIVYGAAGLTLAAAFIEAFWSAHPYLPVTGKYAVGIGIWLALVAWLGLGGLGRSAGGAASGTSPGSKHGA